MDVSKEGNVLDNIASNMHVRSAEQTRLKGKKERRGREKGLGTVKCK